MTRLFCSSVLAMVLASANHAWLCERNGDVSAYEIIHGRHDCAVRYYPPNTGPVTLKEGRECFPDLVVLLEGAESKGWRCDPPVMS